MICIKVKIKEVISEENNGWMVKDVAIKCEDCWFKYIYFIFLTFLIMGWLFY